MLERRNNSFQWHGVNGGWWRSNPIKFTISRRVLTKITSKSVWFVFGHKTARASALSCAASSHHPTPESGIPPLPARTNARAGTNGGGVAQARLPQTSRLRAVRAHRRAPRSGAAPTGAPPRSARPRRRAARRRAGRAAHRLLRQGALPSPLSGCPSSLGVVSVVASFHLLSRRW